MKKILITEDNETKRRLYLPAVPATARNPSIRIPS